MAKEFDPDKHHREHYGTDQLNWLSHEVVDQQLLHFQEVINEVILNNDGPVYGVVIYGSYARAHAGLAKQVHDGSDLDIYAITKRRLKKRPVDFVDKLHEGRTRDNFWGRIGVYVDDFSSISLSDPKDVRKSFFGRGGVIGKYYVIVTPYPEIEQELKAILAKK